jgi:predicted  nucleic acid-binding Zn-ribbon protein
MGPAPLKGSPARKAEIAQDKAAAAVRKKALLVKKNVAVLKRIESDYNDAMSEMRELAAALAKKLAYVKSRTVNGDVDAEEYRSIFDEAATGIGESIEVLNEYNFARSGVKAAFAASLSEIKAWSQALKKEEQASRKTQKANERANRGEYDIDSATEVRVFSGLNAALQRGDKLLVRKLLDEAKREIDATVFRQGVPQALIAWANTTTASRPGAKATMTRDQTEEQKAGLKIMSAADPAVGAKIATLIKEGKPQDQAVAIALDMKRRGEL